MCDIILQDFYKDLCTENRGKLHFSHVWKMCILKKHSLLLRRFVFRMAEASAKRVTGDEPQGTMGRVQTAGEAPSRPLSPSRLPLRAHRERRLGTRQEKTSNGSSFGWLIRQMSINQKSGRKTFRRRFVSGSIFVSPCPPECYFQSETKKEPDLRLQNTKVKYQGNNMK